MVEVAPDPEPNPHWLQAGAFALALHAIVIALAVVTLRDMPRANLAAADTFRVTMVPAPPNDRSPAPAQEPTQHRPAAKPKVKVPLHRLPQTAMPERAAIELPPPAEPPVSSLPQTPVAPESPPAPVANLDTPAPRPAVTGRPSEAWLAEVLAQLERNKRYPAKARYFRQQDTVLVRFTIDRRGHLLSARIVKSQGYADIDAEVLALLRRAQPLVAPPPEVTGDEITETVAIEFYLS
jgi:periplasmic protein TonB